MTAANLIADRSDTSHTIKSSLQSYIFIFIFAPMKDIYFQKAKEMARLASFHDVRRRGKWHGYTVLEPIFTDGELHFTGIPQYILYMDGKLRWTESMEESFEVMDSLG